ncbi:MAG TPA: hypothetical protein VKY74_18865, partial [Chloroflexia bacterium]|nr:hypothetical protein [Chloroflexia bacterium]
MRINTRTRSRARRPPREQPATPLYTIARIVEKLWRPGNAGPDHGRGGATVTPPAAPAAGRMPGAQGMPTAERLAELGRRLAQQHQVTMTRQAGRSLQRRLDACTRFLQSVHAELHEREPREGGTAPGGADKYLLGAEWLLDNFYIIADQITEIRVDLPQRYYAELAKLTQGPLAGYPRVYAVARALLAYTDGALDAARITQFVAAYQAATPAAVDLTLGELWSVPIMLRLALVETLAHLVHAGQRTREQAAAADRWADHLLELAEAQPDQPVPLPPALRDAPEAATPAFVTRLYTRLRDQGARLAPVLQWLEAPRSATAPTLEETLRRDHAAQATLVTAIGNAIT